MDKGKFIRNIYYLSKRLINATSAFFNELFKPTSFLKGDDFEECLRKKVFTKDKYDLVMKTHDYNKNHKDYIESSLYPDYMFRDRINKQEFFVEAKYREKEYQGKIKWCKQSQFKRYKYFNKEDKVLIAIGYGGRPKNPKHIFIIPLEDIKYNSLYLSFLWNYEYINDRRRIIDGYLDRIYDYSKTKSESTLQ
ncbi:MAG: hypothetical protein K9H84_06410 [Bacteroidales bacterium]|nr:hypothetical protein [Bacteroidales bacterium]